MDPNQLSVVMQVFSHVSKMPILPYNLVNSVVIKNGELLPYNPVNSVVIKNGELLSYNLVNSDVI